MQSIRPSPILSLVDVDLIDRLPPVPAQMVEILSTSFSQKRWHGQKVVIFHLILFIKFIF